jgi:hypothetical protein
LVAQNSDEAFLAKIGIQLRLTFSSPLKSTSTDEKEQYSALSEKCSHTQTGLYDNKNENRLNLQDAENTQETRNIYSPFADKVEGNCHFPAPDWNCMTHCQALQGFAHRSYVSLLKSNPPGAGK